MSTRGLYGFRVNGDDYLTYSHSDSYPEKLGIEIVDYINSIDDYDSEIEKAEKVEKINYFKDRPYDHLNEIKNAMNNDIIEDKCCCISCMRSMKWDSILSKLHLKNIIEFGFILDNFSFIFESLFCEWVYIVNFDNGMFEIYKGFQKKQHRKGRYYRACSISGYYPCALIKEYPFNKIPKDWIKEIYEEI